jgi:hypothetical protein
MRLAALMMAVGLAGCGVAAEEDGPVQGYLIVQRPDGSTADFSLGGSPSLTACARMISFELSTAENDHGGEFWTNPEFDYGGGRQHDGWERNVVRGARCEHNETARQPSSGCGANDPLCIR